MCHDTSRPLESSSDEFIKPDRVFAASGRGVTGTITEYRYGLPANVGLYLDTQTTVRQAWLLSLQRRGSYILLLSLPDRTAVLELSEDLSQVEEVEADSVPFDLTSRTIGVRQDSTQETILQITESYLVIASVRTRYAVPPWNGLRLRSVRSVGLRTLKQYTASIFGHIRRCRDQYRRCCLHALTGRAIDVYRHTVLPEASPHFNRWLSVYREVMPSQRRDHLLGNERPSRDS
jgi:hypothetical protein